MKMEVGQTASSGALVPVWFIILLVQLSTVTDCFTNPHGGGRTAERWESPRGVTLHVTDKYVVLDNGILQVTFANPAGYVTGIRYNGLDNLLETDNKESNRGYWDVYWSGNGFTGVTDCLCGSHFEVVVQNEVQTEISFSTKWDSASWERSSKTPRVPLNVDRRYIMLRGHSGFYSYAILERGKGWPQVHMDEIRAVFKLQKNNFHYMAVSDDRQRIMPMPQDRDTGLPLAYKEAVLLTNPTNPNLRGEVDDKYQYSCEDIENKVHGWISFEPSIGFWMITPSNEFRSGGPIKQDLTSHTGPTTLAMFQSTHYIGPVMSMAFENGEPWKKVFGPFFVYLNSASAGDKDPYVLWEDAKHQMVEEVRSWPYAFPISKDYPKARERGSVMGRLFVHDKFARNSLVPAVHAWIGLASPGEAGSWQTESKGYQFWSKADHNGNFIIKEIREGKYNLYGWVPGVLGDYKYEIDITIRPGQEIRLGNIVYKPLRNGPTLWEIGIPDRTAAEFRIPDPSHMFLNKLYVNSYRNKFRQYGLWDRYAQLYPRHDLVYTVGASDYTRDWFYAQVTRRVNDTFKPTTWQIIFKLPRLIPSTNYTLRIALASATVSELQVRFNDPKLSIPHFSTVQIGRDNAIARHGIHGLYWVFHVGVPSAWLRVGNNRIYLTQSKSITPFEGIMYDYIRLEGPSRNGSG